MIRTRPPALLMASAALALSACNPAAPGNGSATSAVTGESGNAAAANKRKLYTEAYNELIDPQAGLPSFISGYRELGIPQADPASAIYFPVSLGIDLQLTRLKDARALPGDATTAAADAAVDGVIAKLAGLMAQAKAIESYYKTRAYRDDALAKGKAADAPLLKAMEETSASLAAFDAALRDEERARNTARIAALRKGGFDAEADMLDMMQKGDRFATAVLANNAAEADRLMPDLEAAATKLAGAVPKGPDAAINKTHFAMIAANGSSMIGAWRDFKASKSETDRQKVVSDYNSAASTASYIPLPTP